MTVNTVDTSTPLVGLKAGAEVYNANFTDSNNAASKEVGTLPDNVPTNADLPTFGTAASANTGTGSSDVPLNSDLPSVLASYLGRNLLINADFSINQRAVSGTVVLSAGEYGHDRFKAGASGCTYTFSKSAGVATITITAGTLLQTVEAATLPATDLILSWNGAAQGRIGSGSYGSSGLVTDATTGGVDITVEFNVGTLARPQLERGVAVTDFEYVNPADQLNVCLRYFERIAGDSTQETMLSQGVAESTTTMTGPIRHVKKRVTPTITASTGSGDFNIRLNGSNRPSTFAISFDPNINSFNITITRDSAAHSVGDVGLIGLASGTGNYIDIDAEL